MHSKPELFERRRLIRQSNLPARFKLVLCVLDDYFGQNETCWLSMRALARHLDVSPWQKRPTIGCLEQLGLAPSSRGLGMIWSTRLEGAY